MEIRNLILVLTFAAKSLAAVNVTQDIIAACLPRLTAVPVDDPSHTFFPYFVELYRCSGSYRGTSPNIFECVSNTTKDVMVGRVNPNTGASDKFMMKNHTSCKGECKIRREQCPWPKSYYPNVCLCECEHKVAPANYTCDAKKSWNQRTCSCQCKERIPCLKPFGLSEETCECVIQPEKKLTCDPLTEAASASTAGMDKKGKFIESRTFWLYVLVAEFLVLVFLFDMILYCKKSGIIYNATRKCRNAKVRDMQSAQEAC